MKRLTFITTISTLAIAAATPALAAPGGGRGGGGDRGGLSAGANAGGGATIERGMGRGMERGQTMDRINNGQLMKGEATTGTRIPDSATRIRSKSDMSGSSDTTTASAGITTMGKTTLTGVETGMVVNDSGGVAIGTVTGVTTKGSGSIRTVQVTLTNGQIITLSPNSLSLNSGVLTTTSVATNVNSEGAAHANINGLIHASPNSALASAGVTSLTGLDAGLTVNNSGGTAIGTVDSIITNRTGAVVAIRVDLTGGGTATIPATTLSMDGSTVVTSSTQF